MTDHIEEARKLETVGRQWAVFENGKQKTSWTPAGYGDEAGLAEVAKRYDFFTVEYRDLVVLSDAQAALAAAEERGRMAERERCAIEPAGVGVEAPPPSSHVRGTPELYAARICKGIPADCCDYGISALAEGVEVCRVWTEENARKIARLLNRDSHARQSNMDGNRPLPYDRETLGRFVREAWVRWAETQPNPKPSWLVPYDELSEPDKEADRQIGEALARWTLIGDAARASFPPSPQPRAAITRDSIP